MGQRAILFVICVNNETIFEQAKRHIDDLIIPPNFSVNVLGIRDAHSMTSAYNTAAQIDAEFKIYIHQDVFIIYKQILIDLVKLFDNHPKLGMIGLSGCVKMPASGVWWEGGPLVGQVIEYRHNTYKLLTFDYNLQEATDYVRVETIDGLFMATRVDIPWREDLFDGFHFYDSSHSMEMQRSGYVIGVPAVSHPWCIHYWNNEFDAVNYYRYRDIFVHNYTIGA